MWYENSKVSKHFVEAGRSNHFLNFPLSIRGGSVSEYQFYPYPGFQKGNKIFFYELEFFAVITHQFFFQFLFYFIESDFSYVAAEWQYLRSGRLKSAFCISAWNICKYTDYVIRECKIFPFGDFITFLLPGTVSPLPCKYLVFNTGCG